MLVAHELGPLAPLVDRAVVMRDGRVAYDGAPLADHEVHHPDFGEAHTTTTRTDAGATTRPHVEAPLDGGRAMIDLFGLDFMHAGAARRRCSPAWPRRRSAPTSCSAGSR